MSAEAQALISGAAPKYTVNSFGVQFTVWGVPQPGGSKTAGRRLDGRTFVRDSNPKAAPWKDNVSRVAGAIMGTRPLFRGPLQMVVVFYVPRPKGHFGARGLRPSAPKFPTKRPDLTKLLRPLEDALTGVCVGDDSQFVKQLLEKRWGEPARAEVTITVLT